jgi:hypothetical protein
MYYIWIGRIGVTEIIILVELVIFFFLLGLLIGLHQKNKLADKLTKQLIESYNETEKTYDKLADAYDEIAKLKRKKR